MIDNYEEFERKLVIHRNRWFWGDSEYVIYNGGDGVVSVQFQDDYPDTATLSCLSVLPSQRTMGIGSRLVGFAEHEALKRGAKRMELGAERDSWLVKWYERMGYRVAETYCEDEYVDEKVVCLVKELH